MEAVLRFPHGSSIPVSYFPSKSAIFLNKSSLSIKLCRVIASTASSSPPPSFPIRHTGKKRVDESKTLTLDGIRNSLIRQEDSIIVSLLERAKYSYNADAYDKDAFFMDGFNGSLVEYMVLQTEKLHSQVGRYKSPDEHAFFPECLPEPALPPLQYPQVLHHCADSININNKIWNMYLKDLLPRLVKAGDDDNCGSVAVCDTLCLQVKEHGCLFFVTFLAHLLRGWSSGARVLPITGHKFVLSLISLERGKYNYLYKFSESGGFLCLEVRHHHAFLLNFKNALA
uniref:chorismate mutase n=1 Tax=Glycine max TaxID=3847 RepID=K7K1Z7_SOYBN